MADDDESARKELRRVRKEIERENARAKEVVELSADELAHALLPTSFTTPKW